jgi:hypothetical protein
LAKLAFAQSYPSFDAKTIDSTLKIRCDILEQIACRLRNLIAPQHQSP